MLEEHVLLGEFLRGESYRVDVIEEERVWESEGFGFTDTHESKRRGKRLFADKLQFMGQ